jgi:hypothetical protein
MKYSIRPRYRLSDISGVEAEEKRSGSGESPGHRTRSLKSRGQVFDLRSIHLIAEGFNYKSQGHEHLRIYESI